jgi:hypothetical protein
MITEKNTGMMTTITSQNMTHISDITTGDGDIATIK